MKERPTNVLHSTTKIQQADTLLKKSIKLLPAVLFLSQVLHTTLIGLNEPEDVGYFTNSVLL